MLGPLKRFLNSRTPLRGTIEAIYGMIVAQAREPLFYQALKVPDTVNGRFDMVVLHLWLVLRRLRKMGDVRTFQALFDHFCSDMDANLREMGVGDLMVPKRMQKFGEAFYGRAAAYDFAFASSREAMVETLARNILNNSDLVSAASLCDYVDQAIAGMDAIDHATLQAGAWRFPVLQVAL